MWIFILLYIYFALFANNLLYFSLSGQNEEEITCQANDKVTVLEDLGDGWLRVRKGKDEGYVPQSYAEYL